MVIGVPGHPGRSVMSPVPMERSFEIEHAWVSGMAESHARGRQLTTRIAFQDSALVSSFSFT